MNSSRINNDHEQIDRKTSRAICDAVGERLQQNMRPETKLSTHLEQLLEELRRRDSERALRAEAKADFTDKWVAFGGGSGDKAACFQ